MNEIGLRFTLVCWVFVLPFLPCVFGLEFSYFCVFCVWRRQSLGFVFCWTRCDNSNPSSLVPNPLESRVLTNCSFSRSWVNPNPLWSSLEFSSSFNLLGEISWGYIHGTVVKVSSKFRWIWTSFAQDSSFGGWILGCLGRTGLTGLGAAGVFKSPLTCPWELSLLSPFLFSPSPSSCSRLGPMSPTQGRIRL